MSAKYHPEWIERKQSWIIPLGNGNIVQPSMVNVVFPVIQYKRSLYLILTDKHVEMASYETDKGNEIRIYVYEDTIVIRKKQYEPMRLEYASTSEDKKKILIKDCLDVLITNPGDSQDNLQQALHEKLVAIEHYFDNGSIFDYPPYKFRQEQDHRAFLEEQERRYRGVREEQSRNEVAAIRFYRDHM